jgi:hypothetical protein
LSCFSANLSCFRGDVICLFESADFRGVFWIYFGEF